MVYEEIVVDLSLCLYVPSPNESCLYGPGYRIPDDRYRGYFGPQHQFRIYNQPFLVVGGYPRFQYNGYWITLVDPWPQSWTNDWYDTDDVYVTYADNG